MVVKKVKGAEIYVGECLNALRDLPDRSVQTCITSPPYFGLRDYGVEGQLGLEKTPDEYVGHLVEVFREVRRVLRDDGTLWLNLGDSYCSSNGYARAEPSFQRQGRNDAPANDRDLSKLHEAGLKTKDLIGIPWRVAFALQADGWYLRQDIIWHKPSPMPESVTDRCTKSHEYIFLLSKSAKYFYDSEAIREPAVKGAGGSRFDTGKTAIHQDGRSQKGDRDEDDRKNKRDVWTVPSSPYAGAHFATFPPALIEPCVLAGSSVASCAMCGAPYRRQVDKEVVFKGGSGKAGRSAEEMNESGKWRNGEGAGNKNIKLGPSIRTKTVGFEPSCGCGALTVPSVVLDPFAGSGTTGLVALAHKRIAILCELNPEYAEIIKTRLESSEILQRRPMFETSNPRSLF